LYGDDFFEVQTKFLKYYLHEYVIQRVKPVGILSLLVSQYVILVNSSSRGKVWSYLKEHCRQWVWKYYYSKQNYELKIDIIPHDVGRRWAWVWHAVLLLRSVLPVKIACTCCMHSVRTAQVQQWSKQCRAECILVVANAFHVFARLLNLFSWHGFLFMWKGGGGTVRETTSCCPPALLFECYAYSVLPALYFVMQFILKHTLTDK
jgi:hypothetical protein